jgi:hypothetical protein
MENNRLVRLGKEFRLFAADANGLYLRQTVPARIRYIDNILHFNQTGAGRPSRTSRRPKYIEEDAVFVTSEGPKYGREAIE